MAFILEKENINMWLIVILGIAALIGLALIIAVIKMAITDAKEEADDIERAIRKNITL